eukprot:8271167-Pyramimonas_sp.AAC.1
MLELTTFVGAAAGRLMTVPAAFPFAVAFAFAYAFLQDFGAGAAFVGRGAPPPPPHVVVVVAVLLLVGRALADVLAVPEDLLIPRHGRRTQMGWLAKWEGPGNPQKPST